MALMYTAAPDYIGNRRKQRQVMLLAALQGQQSQSQESSSPFGSIGELLGTGIRTAALSGSGAGSAGGVTGAYSLLGSGGASGALGLGGGTAAGTGTAGGMSLLGAGGAGSALGLGVGAAGAGAGVGAAGAAGASGAAGAGAGAGAAAGGGAAIGTGIGAVLAILFGLDQGLNKGRATKEVGRFFSRIF